MAGKTMAFQIVHPAAGDRPPTCELTRSHGLNPSIGLLCFWSLPSPLVSTRNSTSQIKTSLPGLAKMLLC